MARVRGRGFRVGYGGFLELLDDGADLGGLAWWGSWLVEDLALCWGQHPTDAIHKLEGILLFPEVNVEGGELVVVFVLVVRIVGREMPLVMALDLADCQGYEAGVLV